MVVFAVNLSNNGSAKLFSESAVYASKIPHYKSFVRELEAFGLEKLFILCLPRQRSKIVLSSKLCLVILFLSKAADTEF
jgi:hypothetical protein